MGAQKGGCLRLLKAVLVTVLAYFLSGASGNLADPPSDTGHLFLIDTQFTPPVTKI